MIHQSPTHTQKSCRKTIHHRNILYTLHKKQEENVEQQLIKKRCCDRRSWQWRIRELQASESFGVVESGLNDPSAEESSVQIVDSYKGGRPRKINNKYNKLKLLSGYLMNRKHPCQMHWHLAKIHNPFIISPVCIGHKSTHPDPLKLIKSKSIKRFLEEGWGVNRSRSPILLQIVNDNQLSLWRSGLRTLFSRDLFLKQLAMICSK